MIRSCVLVLGLLVSGGRGLSSEQGEKDTNSTNDKLLAASNPFFFIPPSNGSSNQTSPVLVVLLDFEGQQSVSNGSDYDLSDVHKLSQDISQGSEPFLQEQLKHSDEKDTSTNVNDDVGSTRTTTTTHTPHLKRMAQVHNVRSRRTAPDVTDESDNTPLVREKRTHHKKKHGCGMACMIMSGGCGGGGCGGGCSSGQCGQPQSVYQQKPIHQQQLVILKLVYIKPKPKPVYQPQPVSSHPKPQPVYHPKPQPVVYQKSCRHPQCGGYQELPPQQPKKCDPCQNRPMVMSGSYSQSSAQSSSSSSSWSYG